MSAPSASARYAPDTCCFRADSTTHHHIQTVRFISRRAQNVFLSSATITKQAAQKSSAGMGWGMASFSTAEKLFLDVRTTDVDVTKRTIWAVSVHRTKRFGLQSIALHGCARRLCVGRINASIGFRFRSCRMNSIPCRYPETPVTWLLH